jgi:2-polyprenyl-3-methyl-5-hydroxy-6-metoxy-1,4-benzoquinol methylase
MTAKQFIYRHRLLGKRIIAMLVRVLPTAASRRLLALAERAAFSLTPQYQGETLPPIFRYWSSRYLAPDAQRLGIGSPEAFFLKHIRQSAAAGYSPVRVLSVGTGTGSMEMGLAAQLQTAGIGVQIRCLDFNPTLMQRAAVTAKERQLEALMTFQTLDCNQPFALPLHDVIIVNQFFHHVTELETLCHSLRESLAPHGVLVSSDIIGRNGHQLWPDVETEVQRIWATLSSAQRHDRHFNVNLARYRPINHAAYSNEGVRAQDIVGCLLAEFDFELFFSFGAAIVPFIERRIGFNFDPQQATDRALIDRVQAMDAAALASTHYPAANMIAALRHKGDVRHAVHEPVSPEQHVLLTRQQQHRARSTRG